MTNQDLIAVLEGVPGKELRILELARRLLKPGGEVDMEACSTSPLLEEIREAVEEAEAYSKQTGELRWSLARLLS